MHYTQRFYRDEADYAAMRRLIADSYQLEGPHAYMLLGDLDWWHALLPEPEQFMAGVPLWFAGAALIGFLWPGESSIDNMLHPQHRTAEAAMLAWAEEHLRKPAAEAAPAQLRQWSRETDVQREELLRAQGFVRHSDFLANNVLALDAPTPEPQLPPGYTIRPITGAADDVEARVAVHRAAFHPSKMTVAKQRAAMASPTYRSDLDLVVVAPDGQLAAFCIVWWEEENKVALFEPVGCHPDYQRRGLGRAVICAGLRRLRELGAMRAHVLSWGEEGASALLYRSIGFRLIDRFYAWDKQYPAQSGDGA